MIALIDGDLVAYRCAASCQKRDVLTESFAIAQVRADNLIFDITKKVSAEMSNIVFFSSDNNFRKTLNPEYKANRTQERPVYLDDLRNYLTEKWQAVCQDGFEADDLMGIWQTKDTENYTICTLDKDLRQVPGNHYSWEIQGTSSLGKPWVRPEEHLVVSPREGLFNFYWQMIMGDSSDNIFGYDGVARNKVPKFLEDLCIEMQHMETEKELFECVRNKYNSDERFWMNGDCLWIIREEGVSWRDHVLNSMGVSGPKVAIEPSLPPH